MEFCSVRGSSLQFGGACMTPHRRVARRLVVALVLAWTATAATAGDGSRPDSAEERYRLGYRDPRVDVVSHLTASNQYSAAERFARQELADAERAHGEDSLEAAEAMELVHDAMNPDTPERAAETERLVRRSLEIKERLLPADDLRLVAPWIELAWMGLHRDPDASIALARRALALRETALGPDHYLVGDAMLELAGILHQVRALKEAGCDFAQGYFFARPMDAAALTASLKG